MKIRKYSYALSLIAALFIPALATLVYNIYIDPFQIIHKDFSKPITFLPTVYARYQQAGIINQYNFESVVLGHSEDANFFPSTLKNRLSWGNTFNLSINGRPLFEQSIVAERVFYKNNIKNVLWGFGIRNLLPAWDERNRQKPLDTYLYDNNRLNDLRFYMTLGMQKPYALKQTERTSIENPAAGNTLSRQTVDRISSWYKGKNICRFGRPRFIARKIIGTQNEYTPTRAQSAIPENVLFSPPEESSVNFQNYKDNFTNNIEPLIASHPNTNFYFVITAYPTLKTQSSKSRNPEKYLSGLKALKQFTINTRQYKNVKIFAYGLETFTDDLRLYKDPGHYHPEVNDYIIEQIGAGKGQLTVDNIDDYLLAFDQKVTNYRLPEKWIPSSERPAKQTGYLSSDVARLLIQNNPNGYTDREIESMALAEDRLPVCAKILLKATTPQK